MECPRCNSKLPDNLKYCGFCGIEIESGLQRVLSTWIENLSNAISYHSDRISDLTPKYIGAATLSIVSLLTLVSSVPPDSIQSVSLLILSVLGLCFGLWLLWLIDAANTELLTWVRMYGHTRSLVITGNLMTTKEINNYLSKQVEANAERLKQSLDEIRSDIDVYALKP